MPYFKKLRARKPSTESTSDSAYAASSDESACSDYCTYHHRSTSNMSVEQDSPLPKGFRSYDHASAACNCLDGGCYLDLLQTGNVAHPSDYVEDRRMDVQHHIAKHVFGANFGTPLEKQLRKGGMRVLDVGCGPGTWVIECANDFPKSTFVGLDMVRVRECYERPPNAGFLQCDILDGLPFPDDTFDFVFQRYMWSAYREDQWPWVLNELLRVTKPGGHIELVEFDWHLRPMGKMTKRVIDTAMSFFEDRGKISVGPHLESMMLQASHSAIVRTEEHPVPMGSWAGAQGELSYKYFKLPFKDLGLPRVLGWNDREFEEAFKLMHHELNLNKTCVPTYRCFVQKV